MRTKFTKATVNFQVFVLQNTLHCTGTSWNLSMFTEYLRNSTVG